MPLKVDNRAVLVVIDVQYSFLPGGSLAVANGDEVIAPINRLGKLFQNVVLTQDWHPAGHVSFASSHAHKKPLDTIRLDYGCQTLWPDHCDRRLGEQRDECVCRVRRVADGIEGMGHARQRTGRQIARRVAADREAPSRSDAASH